MCYDISTACLTCMRNIINISGTCPAHTKPRKLPINTKVDTVLMRKDLILLVCTISKHLRGEILFVQHTRMRISKHARSYSALLWCFGGLLTLLLIVVAFECAVRIVHLSGLCMVLQHGNLALVNVCGFLVLPRNKLTRQVS